MSVDITYYNELLNKFKTKLSIDKYDLDNVLIKQPELYNEIAEISVSVAAIRDSISSDLDNLKARLEREIREEASNNGERATERFIDSRMLLDSRYKKMNAKLLMWKETSGKWEVLKNSCQQRAYIIKDLVALALAGYYATTSISAERHNAEERNYDANLALLAETRRNRYNKQ